ncbi:unnamed protein product [Cunninghamella blakesleeana]
MATLRSILLSINHSIPKTTPSTIYYQQQHVYKYSTSTIISENNDDTLGDINNSNNTSYTLKEEDNHIQQHIEENEIEKHPHTIQTIDRHIDDIWNDYLNYIKDPEITLTDYDYIYVCHNLKKQESPAKAIKKIQLVLREVHKNNMEHAFVVCCNMLIHLYFLQNDPKMATLVFDGLLRSKYKPTEVTVTTLLYGYADHGGKAKDIHLLYKKLKSKGLFPETTRAYYVLIKTLGITLGDAEGASTIFYMVHNKDKDNKNKIKSKKESTAPVELELNAAFYNTMYQIYRKTKQPDLAWELFQKMFTEDNHLTLDSFTYYPLLMTLKEAGNMEEQIQMVYNYMKLKGVPIKPSHFKAMGWDVSRIITEMKKQNGPLLSSKDYNVLIAYAVKKNEFENALDIFNHMKKNFIEPDVYTYGIIMDALSKDNDLSVELVYEVYEELKQKDIQPDAIIYSCLLQACNSEKNFDRAIQYLKEMSDYQVEPNGYILNAYLSLLVRKPSVDSHDIEQAKLMWDHMLQNKIYPDTRSYNNYLALISRIVRRISNDYEQHRYMMDHDDLQDVMEFSDQDIDNIYISENQVEDHHRYQNNNNTDGNSELMNIAPMSQAAKYMMKLYRNMRHTRFKEAHPDFATYYILINTMLIHGQTKKAMLLYRDAQDLGVRLSVVIYNKIMQGLLLGKELHEILQVWQDMKSDNILPDEESYKLVLDTCQQLHLTKTLNAIQDQYILDQPRLKKLELIRERRLKSREESMT